MAGALWHDDFAAFLPGVDGGLPVNKRPGPGCNVKHKGPPHFHNAQGCHNAPRGGARVTYAYGVSRDMLGVSRGCDPAVVA